jgi:ATP-dependent Clp protease ATP-binding subunit ClpC
MFERYTEKARRVVFFARYEASQYGAPYIEPEHLLLGLLREDKALTNRFLGSPASLESIREQIEARITIRERIGPAVEVPLSDQGKRVLNWAAEEAERLSHSQIGPEHLLVGLLRDEQSLAAEILREREVTVSVVREKLAQKPHQVARKSALLAEVSRDLTQAAINGDLDPVVGREQEIDGVVEILCSRDHKNPILIGERGVGKTTIVEGLAQRIADGDVPLFLADKQVLAFDLRNIFGPIRDRQKLEQRLNGIIKELLEASEAIMFIEELQTLVGPSSISGSLDTAEILKPFLLRGEIQCISASTQSEYQRSVQAVPWLSHCFRTMNVPSLGEQETLQAIYGHRERYEKFHQVSYTDDAVKCAVHYAVRYFPDSVALAKTTEVLDAAGSRVKLRQTRLPEEVSEAQKRLKFITHRMESAIAAHEFEKASFYSGEERKEKENLLGLRERYKLDETSTGIVTREDIEEVVSRWSGLPITSMRQGYAGGESDSAVLAVGPANAAKTQERLGLRVFICHSSKDKPAVRGLFRQLRENKIDPWLDEENLLPGQEWDYEIAKVVRSSHVVIVCLSPHSVNKAGYVQREIKKVLDVADEQPEGTIYVIPLKLEECEVPDRLRRWHWVNFFEPKGFERLIQALSERARTVGITL